MSFGPRQTLRPVSPCLLCTNAMASYLGACHRLETTSTRQLKRCRRLRYEDHAKHEMPYYDSTQGRLSSLWGSCWRLEG
ncbi:hypothetical protein CCHR01_07898 [Colletotrichum chrysophilum]|uniref:Uncharacterized protein n=1 Tax=Colletotrichum chrysophilum TaxID=1836956 RepID=A0AAD9EIC6_9PEZI|nr:hypothetical protein CCHR01_07898 [Colletotrichum chrysophilum]